MKDYRPNFWNEHKSEILDLLNNGFDKKYILDYLGDKYEFYPDEKRLNEILKEWLNND